MSDSCQEQHPLLCDDLSEEDQYSPRYKRRFHPMIYRSGASNKVKGAAAIIKRWPDHWYTTVIYWWLGLGMIAITTLVIYNGVVAFALLPSEHIPAPRYPTVINAKKTATDQSSVTTVSMHVFINSINDLDITQYLPYIEILSNKYLDYKYRLIFVVNDYDNDHAHSAEENNEIALNSLMEKSHIHSNINDIIIEQVILSKYMNSSPLKKHWRSLPKQFIEFLVRAISVWERGGIAFNPVILTPYSSNVIYIEKLHGILREYKDNSNIENIRNITVFEMKKNNRKVTKKPTNKYNNIRDIIDAIDESDVDTYNEHVLDEAEAKEILTLVERSTGNQINSNTTEGKLMHKASEYNAMPTVPIIIDNQVELKLPSFKQNAIENIKINSSFSNNNTANFNYLPLFLKLLFNKKSSSIFSKTQSKEEPKTSFTRKRKSVIPKENKINKNLTSVTVKNSTINETAKYIPMIISYKTANKNVEKTNVLNELKYYDGQLIIDLKGNILATKTSCHAFIGTIFNNVIHHMQNESVTEFIETELSLFCKGLLSTCNGIDVILV